MADSTAFIDTTSIDVTSFLYVSDSTALTPLEAAQQAQAESLVSDFDSAATPVETQAKSVQETFDEILDLINNIDDYTPASLMDQYTQQGMDAAFGSSSWLAGPDGLNAIKTVQQQ